MQSSKSTSLDAYRLLGNSGLRVSPLCLGTMTFGNDWGWGADKEESQLVFNKYVELGGNFIDTANIYTNGTSETFIGEFIQSRREQIVLATKYSNNTRKGDPNASGNHRKNMVQSVENSLKRLKTDYIDLYWLHIWESHTPIEEVMRALDDLVRAGKILYTAISDTPAWRVSQGNTLASLRGWTPFIALQVGYNLIERTPERELIPMAQELNLAVLPWSPLAGGILTGKYKREDAQNGNGKAGRGEMVTERLTDKNFTIAEEVQKIATELGCSSSQVSLNWLLTRPTTPIPILGARTLKHLEDNLGCLNITLSPEQLDRLEKVSQIELGFPHDFIASDMVQEIFYGGANVRSQPAMATKS